jgi:hypothetical protein
LREIEEVVFLQVIVGADNAAALQAQRHILRARLLLAVTDLHRVKLELKGFVRLHTAPLRYQIYRVSRSRAKAKMIVEEINAINLIQKEKWEKKNLVKVKS